MNHLTFTFVTTGPDAGQLRPVVDGEDLLDGYRNNRGLPPDRLLPPLSSTLLPTRAARSVLIGCCSCGETGCGSLWLSLHRDGDQVIWAPVPDPRGETLGRSYRFGLVDYLDAVDAAAADRPGEGRGLRVARLVRLTIGLYDGRYESLIYFRTTRIDWVSSWPWDSDTVKASLSDADGHHVLEFDAEPEETDRQFAARIAAELNERRMPRPRSRDT
jgi:hypothetical protein